MGLWRSVEGVYQVEIVSSDISQTLSAIQNNDINLSDICFLDDLHLCASVLRKQLLSLQKLLDKRGEEIKLIKKSGIYWSILRLRSRPVLLVCAMIIFLLSIILPTRILFVEVEGNQFIAEKSIIETASNCGIRFFASRRAVRSEKMKNALLNAIPQLQWAGVNTKGCVAVISVRERKEEPQKEILPAAGSIVALRDGIIKEMTVLNGTPLCKVGQGVKKGQVLISGYTDCGLIIKAQRADGEILGQTFHQIEAVAPTKFMQRGAPAGKHTKIKLRIGKNIINFSKDSGISDPGCVKMYEEKFLTLPGGFTLPVALITETCTYTDLQAADDCDKDFSWLQDTCEKYIKSIMVAGRVLERKTMGEIEGEIFTFKGKYVCNEMIGQIRYEEIVRGYGA